MIPAPGEESLDPADVSPWSPSAGRSSLPRGRHNLPHELVDAQQRERLLAGAAGALAEHGYAAMSVEHVIVRAGISRTTFYQHFDNKRECVLNAHEQAFDRLATELVRACDTQSQWSSKVTAAIAAAILFAIRTPDEAQLLVIETFAADPVLAERAMASNDFLVGLLRNGREHCPQAASLPELTERALVGAIISVIGRRLFYRQADQLAVLAPQLIQLTLIPYVGGAEAARIAKIAPLPPDLTQ